MNRRNFLKNTATAGLLTLITPTGIFRTNILSDVSKLADLKKSFLDPPDSGRTHTFWFWMNGNITKSGITSDLEAIKKAGVGGVLNFDAGTGMVKGPVDFGSAEYWDLKNHAIRECERLGLFFGMHNCPGWSSSGGPWVTPEFAMQELTWSELRVNGGSSLNIKLPKPFNRHNFYRDITVLAYPALPGEEPMEDLLAAVTSNKGLVNKEQLIKSDIKGVDILTPQSGEPSYLQFEFSKPYEACYLSFLSSVIETGDKDNSPKSSSFGFQDMSGVLKLEISDDGFNFREITTINTGGKFNPRSDSAESFIAVDLPKTKAKYFRLTCTKSRRYSMVRFSGSTRLGDWKSKANFVYGGDDAKRSTDIPDDSIINANAVVNLSEKMDSNGNLSWDAPVGNWVILRIGNTAIGTTNNAAPEGGEGLEIDKYNKEAMEMHFNAVTKELLASMSPFSEKGKVYLEIDSWEVGLQNWTQKLPEEFQKRTGYDLSAYLLVMTGRIIDCADISERFLWDLRRVLADMIADNYYGHFAELCKKHGFASYNEPYENGPFEELQISSRVDVSIGEFWSGLSTWFQHNYEHRRSTKLCASVAHTYGRKIVGAEAFTAEAPSGKWQQYPFAMKALGDKFFTEGLTRVVFHRYAMQPHPDTKIAPGMTMAFWGIHFERTNTWWEQSRGWLDYLARCQYLLQQGLFVADIAYFTGEGAPNHTKIFRNELRPIPPDGYDYDMVNREVVLTRMEINNGRIVLPDGMSYRVLVIQDYETMTLELLQKLYTMVMQGMILVGAKPKRTPGLSNRSGNDEAMLDIANKMWGNLDGTSVTERSFGLGRIYWGDSLQTILDKLNIAKDFEFSSLSGDAPVRYIHRTIDGKEIYFVCNERRSYENLVCTFRVNGKQPEFWDAETGEIISTGVYDIASNSVRVPVQLKPYGSMFVVFDTPASDRRLQRISFENKIVMETAPFPGTKQANYKDVADSFTISLWIKPEIDIMLSPSTWNKYRTWTDYYAIYPPSGSELYGKGHETCGMAVGRNGVAIWHRESKWPFMRMAVTAALEGWTHIALIYNNREPLVYINGKAINGQLIKDKNAGGIVHPGLGKAFITDGASYYNGDMLTPQLYNEVLTETQIAELAKATPNSSRINVVPFIIEASGYDTPKLLFHKNGNYSIQDSVGRVKKLVVSEISEPQELSGSWDVSFPSGLGAPSQIKLQELISLHKHETPGVKYFSGNATYTKQFEINTALSDGKRLYLDLGQVEISAKVYINGIDLGILWTRPYQVDITNAVKIGVNELKVMVVNLWPNRLIGDEQLPQEYEFEPPIDDRGACIKKMPDWYLKGEPKPKGQRIAFSTWQHYKKTDPLLESGLIGPVVIKSAIIKSIT